MTPAAMVPRRFAVAAHPKIEEAASLAVEIAAFLTERGAAARHGGLQEEDLVDRLRQGAFGMLIAPGGDRPLPRAEGACAGRGRPDPAPALAQHPAGAGGASPLGGPGDRPGRRVGCAADDPY